jgi:hypothetical protein
MPFTLPAGIAFAAQAIQQNIQVEGEARLRFERRLDRDFNAPRKDNRNDLFQRYRIGIKWKSGAEWSGAIQYQLAHDLFWTPTRNASDESSDLLMANAVWSKDGRTVTLGRQRLILGSERLIGALEWVNTARTFDAVRYQDKEWDLFVGRVAVQNPLPGAARVGGVSYKSIYGQTSLLYKHDASSAGSLDLWTLAHAYRKLYGEVEFDGEFAYQFGKNLGRNHQAWAYHLQFSTDLAPKWRGSLEWNAASGGPSTGTSRTFDNLYPTNHKFYGVMDLFAWRNMNQLQLTVTHRPRADLELKGRIISGWLQDATDAWYSAGGRPNVGPTGNFRDATGLSGRHLGWEYDLEASWKRNAKETLSAGVGLFSPGDFVRTQAKDDRRQLFLYVQYAIRF